MEVPSVAFVVVKRGVKSYFSVLTFRFLSGRFRSFLPRVSLVIVSGQNSQFNVEERKIIALPKASELFHSIYLYIPGALLHVSKRQEGKAEDP